MKAGGPRDCLHRALLDAVARGAEPNDEMRLVIEHLIAAVLALQAGHTRPSLAEGEIIRAARKLVEARVAAGKPVQVAELAKAARCSAPHLNRTFRRSLGVSAKTFVDQYRFETARRLLLESSLSVGEISAELGFDDPFRFSRFFKRMGGHSPRAYRDRHHASLTTHGSTR